jgi:membrane-associated protease RseP (regulator of RpoE activity)
MCGASSNDHFTEPTDLIAKFEQIRIMVESEFDVEEGFVEHGVPTFYVKLREDSKEAFLRLTGRMNPLDLIPVLRRKEEKVVLQTIPKLPTKPSRSTINVYLFLATLGTLLVSGYLQSMSFYPEPNLSLNIVGALTFAGAMIAILGSHEMGHKLTADKHEVEATYPYFIPGIPPLGTFGAVIQQKSLPPNRDALFDIGIAGPLMSFVLSIVFAIIGITFSSYTWIAAGTSTLPVPILFRLIGLAFQPLGAVPPRPEGPYSLGTTLHPVAFAGWVGMLVTMLNLVPTGMFDGGHVARSIVGRKAHQILSYLGIILLMFVSFPMAFLALFFSMYRHPGPLDDVSKLTTKRKLAAIVLITIFILCIVPISPLF